MQITWGLEGGGGGGGGGAGTNMTVKVHLKVSCRWLDIIHIILGIHAFFNTINKKGM